MRRHGLDHIGYGEDYRFWANVIAVQAVGISGAIRAFMMTSDHIHNCPGEIQFTKGIGACVGMLFDDFVLVCGELSESCQDL